MAEVSRLKPPRLKNKSLLNEQEHFEMYFGRQTYGGVYFIQGVKGGPIKIGHTKKLFRLRLATLQSTSPVELVIRLAINGASVDLEGDLHREFANIRLHGEWFKPTRRLTYLIDYWRYFHPQGSIHVPFQVENNTPETRKAA